MSTVEYIFVERDYELTGRGSVDVVLSDTKERAELVATIDDISVRDHGNGVNIRVGGRKPINLDYHQIADIIRCIRMMDARNVSEGHLPLDISDMFAKVSVK